MCLRPSGLAAPSLQQVRVEHNSDIMKEHYTTGEPPQQSTKDKGAATARDSECSGRGDGPIQQMTPLIIWEEMSERHQVGMDQNPVPTYKVFVRSDVVLFLALYHVYGTIVF